MPWCRTHQGLEACRNTILLNLGLLPFEKERKKQEESGHIKQRAMPSSVLQDSALQCSLCSIISSPLQCFISFLLLQDFSFSVFLTCRRMRWWFGSRNQFLASSWSKTKSITNGVIESSIVACRFDSGWDQMLGVYIDHNKNDIFFQSEKLIILLLVRVKACHSDHDIDYTTSVMMAACFNLNLLFFRLTEKRRGRTCRSGGNNFSIFFICDDQP